MLEARIGDPEAVDPVDLGKEPQHLADGVGNAEQQDNADEAVEPGVVHECRLHLGKQHCDENGDDQQEEHHSDEIDLRQIENSPVPVCQPWFWSSRPLSSTRIARIDAKRYPGKMWQSHVLLAFGPQIGRG